ncbi:hypothetical protein PR048_012929 [Dryococelus australis]|uniref:Uncharacterized protein n=1 Tax=Dryococelus australis TaxID=614101 RepID=A0ABQ9HR60_9NEOP|nr:hypothetical protein PR048_012929 [Dryococelus australis]
MMMRLKLFNKPASNFEGGSMLEMKPSCTYATVNFVCSEHNGKVRLELLQAKGRDAQLKGHTVPPLELPAETITHA